MDKCVLRSTNELPKAGQLWRVKEDTWVGGDFGFNSDGQLFADQVLMVVADGRWFITHDNGWLCDESIQQGFHVSVIFGEKIHENMRANIVWWNKHLELVELNGKR